LGIYLHWPYCSAICPYCDFNVFRARQTDHAPLLEAIVEDMAAHARRFGSRQASTLFLGGGTPSLLSGREIGRLIEAAQKYFSLTADAEITLEANPEDRQRFAEHAASGVNRFSIGAQAFDDAALRALGRRHNGADARQAVEAAAATGQRVSLDLIYAREGQSVEAWSEELGEALKLPVEHVSLYQLTIEPHTAFARRLERGALKPPASEEAAALYEATQEVCDAAGFPAYEISNHARSEAAQARHNLIYWRSADWIGVGPGAHGRVTHEGVRIATEARRLPGDYIDAVREHGLGWINETELDEREAAEEAVMMGLRTDDGFELGAVFPFVNEPARAWLLEQGLIAKIDGRIALTRAGRLLANQVAAELLS
jgi:oxygen-independent coproporphyrinogen-3 oxidase